MARYLQPDPTTGAPLPKSRGAERPVRRGVQGFLRRGISLGGLLSERLRDRWRNYRKRLKQCQKTFSEESVHDLRISLRKLLALLDVLRALRIAPGLGQARRRLKRQLKQLSRLRDVQIQRQYLEKLQPAFPQVGGYHDLLVRRQAKAIRQIKQRFKRVKANKALKQSARMLDLCQDDAGTASQRLASVVLKSIQRAWREVLEKKAVACNPSTIHCLRVAFKKFRYLIESMGPALAGLTQAHIRAMQEVQGLMGEIQDLQVLAADLKHYGQKLGKEQRAPYRVVCREVERLRRGKVAAFLGCVDDRLAALGFFPVFGSRE